jgi:hypothetical protein
MKDININWEGPFTLEEVRNLNTNSDFGLYQYYGEHPVYGQHVLLYIGKAEHQNFSERMAQHNWQHWIPSDVNIYVGKICTKETISNADWEHQITLAEKIMIFSHSPAFNTANLNQINHREDDVRVLNWGQRKSLLPEVSISRWERKNSLGHTLPKELKPCCDIKS